MKKTFTDSTTFPWAAICPWELIIKSNKSWCTSRKKDYIEDPHIKDVKEIYNNKLLKSCDLSEFIKVLCECKKKRIFKKYNVKTFNHITSLAIGWLNTQRSEPLHPNFLTTINGLSEHLTAGTSEEFDILEKLWVGIPPKTLEETEAGIVHGMSKENNRWLVIKNNDLKVTAAHKIINNYYTVKDLGGEKLTLPLNIEDNSGKILNQESQIRKLKSIFKAKEYFENRLFEVLNTPSQCVMDMTHSEVVIVEDDEAQTEEIISSLQDAFPRMQIHWTDNISKASEILKKRNIDLLIMDEAIQDKRSTEWLLKTKLENTKIILITGYASMQLEEMVKTKLPEVQFQIKPLNIKNIKL